MRDMHELLQIAREDAPPARYSVDDIVAAGRRRRRWAVAQRAGLGTAAAAVVTAGVLVAGNVVLSPGGGGAQPAAPKAPQQAATQPGQFVIDTEPFTFTFDAYRVGAYQVQRPDAVNLGHQSANIVRLGENYATDKNDLAYVGEMTVYRPGAFKPEKFLSGAKVTVQGREAYRTQFTRMSANHINRDGEMINGTPVRVNALAWQYGPDAWAVIEQSVTPRGLAPFPTADQAALAERLRPRAGAGVKATVPFIPGYLPAGFELLAVHGQSMYPSSVRFVYGRPDASTDPLTEPMEFRGTSAAPRVEIGVLWRDSKLPPDAMKRTGRCNEGQHWCMKNLPGGEFYAAAEDASKTLPDSELLKVLDNLRFANLKKADTWHPVG